ncbi:hypothetical protein Lal_00041105 [Lupinus albus]|nr:hypothetical protein Lal_00041105 [Lupinus albus]
MNEAAPPPSGTTVAAPMPGAQPMPLRPDERPSAGVVPAPPVIRGGLSPLNRRRLANFRANRLGYWSFVIFAVLFVVSLFAEFIANDKPLLVSYKGEEVRRLPRRHGLSLAGDPQGDHRERLGDLAADPVLLRYDQREPADPLPLPADLDALRRPVQAGGRTPRRHGLRRHSLALARHRQHDPRRPRPRDLRLPHLGAVRADPGRRVLGHRCPGRGGAGLFRRLGRSRLPALHRGLGRYSDPLPHHHHLGLHRAGLLRAARHHAALLVGGAGERGARRIPAGAQFRIRARRPGARPVERADHARPPAAQRHGRDPDLHAVHPERLDHHPHLPRLPRLRPAPGSPSLGELLAQGKDNLTAPWLGLTGFVVIAAMLSLLVFAGEAVRDAFDPRKTFA